MRRRRALRSSSATSPCRMLKTIIVAAVVLRVISLVNSPDILLILTGGGPGRSTLVLSLYAFQKANKEFNFGYGSALAVVLFVLLMALLLSLCPPLQRDEGLTMARLRHVSTHLRPKAARRRSSIWLGARRSSPSRSFRSSGPSSSRSSRRRTSSPRRCRTSRGASPSRTTSRSGPARTSRR